MAEGSSSRVHILFISAVVAEGGILRQGYLLWFYCGGNTPHSLYKMIKLIFKYINVLAQLRYLITNVL